MTFLSSSPVRFGRRPSGLGRNRKPDRPDLYEREFGSASPERGSGVVQALVPGVQNPHPYNPAGWIKPNVPAPPYDPELTIPDHEHRQRLDHVHGLVVEGLDRATNLRPVHRRKYGQAMFDLLARLPKQAVKLVHQNLNGVRFHPSVRHVHEALDRDYAPSSRPRRSNWLTVAGYTPDGLIYIDGGTDLGEGPVDPSHVYAHELSHAIDGKDHRHSLSHDWWDFWNRELADGQLTEYGGSNPAEGFAEFGRLLHGRPTLPIGTIKARFPRSLMYWRMHGLWNRRNAGH